jgi:two-component system, cell cycle sensor histidine kinase and response regulator CckA
MRLLLVDDNKDDRALVIRGIRARWPEATVVEVNTADGLTAALADRPDAVITDYQLRFSDGLTLLRSVKALWPDVPVIMYTGTGSEQIAVEAMKAGLEDYVLKTPGQIPHLVAAVRLAVEASEQHRALIAAEGRYRSLYDGVPVGLFRATPGGTLLDCNPAFARILAAASRESLIGKNIVTTYTDPAERAGLVARLEEAGVIRFEGWRRRQDGSLFWTITSAQVVRGPDGHMLYYEGTVEDATEHKRAEEALKAVETRLTQSAKLEAVGRLAGGVAHDFNNLLGVIMGYADLMLKRMPAEEPLRRNVQEIQKAAERASALTKQLLAFSRRQILQPRVLDLNQSISEVESMLQRVIGEDIALVTVLRDVGHVKADPGQIQQVLMNLVVNARDAMPRGGRLTIETASVDLEDVYAREHVGVTPGPFVMMAVSDTGVGMDQEVQAHIFEPFFSTKGPEKGTGLGLATVYGIVKQSGGNVWVYSEPGRGATFKVYLPRVEEASPRAGSPPLRPVSSLGTETVLLVEDDEKVREVIALALKDAGYRVLEARSGEQALLQGEPQTDPVHLLVTDLVMPGMSGRELAERWQATHPETRTLFMSGYTDGTVQHQAGLPPGAAFIQKPFAPSTLARKVREVLERRPKA